MDRLIIGIAGYKGCGKTTAAKALYGIGFTRVRFADGLKNMLKCIGLEDAHIDGELKELPCDLLGGKSPRFAMQTLGTEWGRDIISPTLWTDDWKRRVNATPKHTPIVVDDLRFPNEQDLIHEFGGEIILIERNGFGRTSPHASEDLSHIVPDYKIQNADMKAFQTEIRELGLKLKERDLE